MTNNMLQTTAYSMSPYVLSGGEALETYRAQQLQKQIRAFITSDGTLSRIYSRNPEQATVELCNALTTVTGKDYEASLDGLEEGWYDLEQLVLAWQSPYGRGWTAQPSADS